MYTWAYQAENNVLQWGLRGGSVSGEAASLGVGTNANYGAGEVLNKCSCW